MIEVVLGGRLVARTDRAFRVLETSHPPTYYLPRSCFAAGSLREAAGGSFCEWKGQASYLDVLGGDAIAPRAAWFYASPTAPFAALVDTVALYPGAMDRCTVDGELVRAQPGGFYGGWVTSAVVGPVKGEPGTSSW
ncbi:MAG TPA: DUF427 domain-containing protein [Nocardioidaceae bacterium]|nr:DUF427 domain-containing protein [Nocardioidaceae bacterium]